MSNGVHTVLRNALLLRHKINIRQTKQWNYFLIPSDAKFGMLYTIVIVIFYGSSLMKSLCLFMWYWVCLLFLPITIKQSKMPAVVTNNGVVVLSPVSACAEDLAH